MPRDRHWLIRTAPEVTSRQHAIAKIFILRPDIGLNYILHCFQLSSDVCAMAGVLMIERVLSIDRQGPAMQFHFQIKTSPWQRQLMDVHISQSAEGIALPLTLFFFFLLKVSCRSGANTCLPSLTSIGMIFPLF